MGLCIFSGPSWEEDSLNELNENSIQSNAEYMLKYSTPWLVNNLYKEFSSLPNVISKNLENYVKK